MRSRSTIKIFRTAKPKMNSTPAITSMILGLIVWLYYKDFRFYY